MRERVKMEVVSAVERYARDRAAVRTNKQILAEFPGLSQTKLSRMLRAARRKLRDQMTRDCQSS